MIPPADRQELEQLARDAQFGPADIATPEPPEIAKLRTALAWVRAERDYLIDRLRLQQTAHEGMQELLRLHQSLADTSRERIEQLERKINAISGEPISPGSTGTGISPTAAGLVKGPANPTLAPAAVPRLSAAQHNAYPHGRWH